MPLFRRSKPSQPRYPVSTEDLVHSYTPPESNPSGFPSDLDSRLESLHLPPDSLHRSLSQRQPHQLRDRPAVSGPEDPQPRRLKKSLFVRPPSGFLERSGSVRNKPFTSSSQPTSPRWPLSLATDQDGIPAYEDQSPASAKPYDRPTSLVPQQPHQPHSRAPAPRQGYPTFTTDNPERSQVQPPPQQDPLAPTPPPARPSSEPSEPDPAQLDQHTQPSTDAVPESPRYAPEHGQEGQPNPLPHPHPHPRTQQDLVLNARPPSRHTYEPHSPVQTQSQNHPDAMQQASAQAQQPSTDRPSEAPLQASRRGSVVQNMPEQGRQTPPTNNRARDETTELDVRALIQKHDELQSKYSKVKRYYFEKEAQVQHLQNTVAHQRMAVSRTVLDDNEYTNRFQRLDGAIKDLAFAVRKEWRGVPAWLHGLVTDDAVQVGTKEMTAVGRAIISRWIVEEVFQRHFHPGLDTALSLQLKSIEMNLRRQQMRPTTDEDRENAIARLSNWRRTTFDGLGDTLANPEAQEHRAELIEHLTAELASFLSNQVREVAQSGIEAGVRMIIENTINIAEKIPLEARDVCVEYFPPNITFHETYMRVEGQLPPLTRQPPPPADQDPDESAAVEGDSSPASNSGGDGASPAPREPRKKSVLGALIGRKPATEPSRPVSGPPQDDKPEQADNGPARIRFASFMTVEVRGKGQSMVLAKSPVWLID